MSASSSSSFSNRMSSSEEDEEAPFTLKPMLQSPTERLYKAITKGNEEQVRTSPPPPLSLRFPNPGGKGGKTNRICTTRHYQELFWS